MYAPGMTAVQLQELAAAGLTPDDVAPEPVEIWPDNLPAYNLLCHLSTQWRSGGMGGATGLDYNVMYHKMDRMKLSPEAYESLEYDIQVMEGAALLAMHPPEDPS